MKIGKIIKATIKLAPIVYPIIKKVIDNKSLKDTTTTTTTTTRKK